MGKTSLIAIALGLATASHATLIDDFDALNLGSINELSAGTPNPTSGWQGTQALTTTGNGLVIADPIAGIDQALQITAAANASSGQRGVYKPLGDSSLFEGQSGTLSFELAAASATSTVRNYFGIGNTLNNPISGQFNQFEAAIFFQQGTMYAVDSSSGSILNFNLGSYTANTWYSFDLVIDTVTDTYDVYVNSILVGDNLGFRNSGSGNQSLDLDKITFWSSSVASPNNTSAYLDSINIVVVPEPTSVALLATLGVGLLFIRRRLSC